MELLYRGTKDGMSGEAFHNKCNNKGPTITLIKNDKGYIFGGYASIDWVSYDDYRSAPESFLFNLTNTYNIAPTKFPNSDTNKSIYEYSSSGPDFGSNDIEIYFPNNICTYFPTSYKDVLGKGRSIFTGDNNNSNYKFNLKEIEVFKLI